MPEVFDRDKALPLVLFVFTIAMLFTYLRLNAPLKEMSQVTLNMLLITLPVIAVSLAAKKQWLPIADLGSNVLGLFGLGLAFSLILFFMVSQAEPGSFHPCVEGYYDYAVYVGVPLAVAEFSAREMAINLLVMKGIFLPIGEELAFLTLFFLSFVYFNTKLKNYFGAVLIASFIVAAFFSIYHFTAYSFIYNAKTITTAGGQIIANPDYIPNLSPLNPSSIIAMLSTKVGFSAFLMRMGFNLIALMTGSYVAAIGMHMGVNLLLILSAAGIPQGNLIFLTLLFAGALIGFSRFVQGKKTWT